MDQGVDERTTRFPSTVYPAAGLPSHAVDLAPLTTLRLGGPARSLVEATTEAELVRAASDPATLLLAGGSNVVVADAGVDATVVRVLTRGVAVDDRGDHVVLRAAAGEPWDDLVARCVADGLVGVECLAGIPGSTGATPIQNVGAYGQEVADTVVAVRVLDRATGAVAELAPADCGFGYRTSAFKRSPGRWAVLDVALRLERGSESAPIRYSELARTLGVETGARAPLAEAREAVLELRRGKGMVLDPGDHDTWSAGSFFTNPFVDAGGASRRRARVRAARRDGEDVGGLAHRARGLPPRLRRPGGHRDLLEAHARAHEPRRGHHGRARRAGPGDRRRGPWALRRDARAGARVRGGCVVRLTLLA